MPPRPLRPCRNPVCPKTTRDPSGYCDICKPDAELKLKMGALARDKARGTAAERGYGRRWQRERLEFMRDTVLRQCLREYPCCEAHLKKGDIVRATHVDHIKPHHGDYKLMWDRMNWQCLCAECHSIKTAKEDGAFGNRRKDCART